MCCTVLQSRISRDSRAPFLRLDHQTFGSAFELARNRTPQQVQTSLRLMHDMPTTAPQRGAVFLSYASQDAKAASASAKPCVRRALRYGSTRANWSAGTPGIKAYASRSASAPSSSQFYRPQHRHGGGPISGWNGSWRTSARILPPESGATTPLPPAPLSEAKELALRAKAIWDFVCHLRATFNRN